MTFHHKPRVLLCNLAKDLLTMQFFMQKIIISKENSMCRGATLEKNSNTNLLHYSYILCHSSNQALSCCVCGCIEYSLNKWCYLEIQREVWRLFIIVDSHVHSSHNDNSYGFVVYTIFHIGSAFYNASAIIQWHWFESGMVYITRGLSYEDIRFPLHWWKLSVLSNV